MRPYLKIISFVGLAVMFTAAVLAFAGTITPHGYRLAALAGTALWFGTVPFWMKRRLHHSE
jgi:hypothetical protein